MHAGTDLVSVIIPVFNCAQYVGQAVESVLAQSYRAVEVIVVDDGSTDRSAEAVKSAGAPIRYVYQENAGRPAARNRGVDMAQGRFIAFLDADDLWEKEKLACQVRSFEDDPGLDLVFGKIRNFLSPELCDAMKEKLHCPQEPMEGYSPCTVLGKREVFARVGRFNQDLKVGEFTEWFMRASELGVRHRMLPETVALRRLYKEASKASQDQYRADYLKILKASLDRKRNNSK